MKMTGKAYIKSVALITMLGFAMVSLAPQMYMQGILQSGLTELMSIRQKPPRLT